MIFALQSTRNVRKMSGQGDVGRVTPALTVTRSSEEQGMAADSSITILYAHSRCAMIQEGGLRG